MKRITIIFLMVACLYSGTTFAQYCGLTYTYDAGGNRIKRKVTPSSFCEALPPGGEGGSGKRDTSEDTAKIHADNLTQSLFPNPTSGKVNIIFSQAVADAQVIVTDNLGKRLYVTSASGTAIPLDISGYSSGVYFIIVKTEKKVFRNTVVKE